MINRILLAGDKFMPDMYVRQPRFTYSSCRLFTKNKAREQKFKETGNSRYIYQNELDKACFQLDMAYEDFKDLPRKTVSDKTLRVKQLVFLKIQNMMAIKEVLLQWFLNLLIRNLLVVMSKVKFCQINNQQKHYTIQLLENLKNEK